VKVAVAIAILLGLAALALGIAAVMDDDGATESLTLHLTEESENERALDVGRDPALVFFSPISGDRAGEIAGLCLPAGDDGIGCIATYILEDGTITAQNIRGGEAQAISSAIIGGTGAYEGAWGTRTIPDPDSSEHTLELELPAD
jgi:hypothetical protein